MTIRHIKVIGRVQGIGYRRWVEDLASQMNLSGWARNTSDGAVEIMVKGGPQDLNVFLEKCLHGPAFSKVLGIQPVVVPQSTPAPIEDGIFKIIASA